MFELTLDATSVALRVHMRATGMQCHALECSGQCTSQYLRGHGTAVAPLFKLGGPSMRAGRLTTTAIIIILFEFASDYCKRMRV
jgi:hypothetical protein